MERTLCSSSDLNFGECNASKLSVEISDIEDISGLKIQAYVKVSGYENDIVVFTGYAESARAQPERATRKVAVYDDLYRHANDNVSDWYNGIFPSSLKSNYKGEWDSKTKYISPHVVKYDGNYYQYLCSASDKFSVVTGYDDNGNEIKQTYYAADYLVGKTPEEAASDVDGYKYVQILDVYNPYDYGYITIKAFRDSLFSHVGIAQESVSLINDSVKITKTIDSDEIKFSDCIKAICQINAVFGHISEIGVFQYISLGGSAEDYSGNYKATSTTYEEFSTKAIDSVRLYDNAGNIASIYGSGQNYWNIVNNFLIYNLSSSVLNGIATRLYSAVSGIRYTPYSLQALVSLFPVGMGAALSFTTHTGTSVASYVLKDKLSGSQLVNQTISANGTETRSNSSSTLESLNQLNSRTKAIVEKIYQKLTADNAEIKTIYGDLANYKVIVTDEIQAISGDFEYVRSDYGEFKDFATQNFTAIDGRINNLSGDLASFKVGEFEELRSRQAVFETATAENFSAQEAEIKTLSGDFASFKTGEFETLRSKQAEFETTTTQSITSVTGKIDTLSGDLATYKTVVAENFESTNAQITSISGDYSNFKEQTAEKFTAAYADIEHLKTTTLELDELIADKASISDLNAVNAEITNLKATQITSEYLDSNFAKIDLANIEKGCITTAMLGTAVVGTTQIADGSITDAKIVELTANKINAGTLSVERLEIRGSSNSIVYALNDITGALQSQNVDTLNGEILTPRSITADRIVANAITANEIAAKTITANEIAAYSITANEIAADTITSREIAAGSITANEIAANTITSREIASKTITADKIAAKTITSAEINVTDLFAQDITATGTIRGVKLEGATGSFTGSVTATSLNATQTGEISIFKFDSYGMRTDFTGDGVLDYSFSKGIFTARIYNSSNAERAYFYMDTEEDVPEVNGRAIIFGNECVDLSVSSGGEIRFVNDTISLPVASVDSSGNVYAKAYYEGGTALSSKYLALSGGTVTGYSTFNAGLGIKNCGLELFHSTPAIDFHFNNSTDDYTSRIIESASGRLAIPGKLSIGGYTNDSYKLAVNGLISNTWVRTTGQTGWYSETYGGGWYMTDSTWVRAYNNKSILTTQTVQGSYVRGTAGLFVGENTSVNPYIYTNSNRDILLRYSTDATNYSYTSVGAIISAINGKAAASHTHPYLSTSGGEVSGRISSLHGTYTATASERFRNSALEIRENDLVGSAQSDAGYAPSIGFHWGGRTAATLFYHSDGKFYFFNQAFTAVTTVVANLCANTIDLLSGNALTIGGRFVVPPSGTAAQRAAADNAYTCGHASYRYTYVYAVSGTIQTSDEREKDILSGLSPEDLSDYFMSLKPIAYRWNSGNDRRIHFGLGAQTAKSSLEQAGYNPEEFSLIQHDILDEVSATGLTDRYGMDYQGYNILTMAQTQKNTRDIMAINDWQKGVDVELACVSAKQESLEYRIVSLQEQLAEANARIAEQAAEIEALKTAS